MITLPRQKGMFGVLKFMSFSAAMSLLCATSALAGSPPQPASQAQLTPLINDGMDAKDALHFDWPAVEIGTGQYEAGPTGVTVFRFPHRALGAIDVRGGGPGTVNSDYLRLGYSTRELDAVVLSGGSWYGLETVTATNTALKDDGVRNGDWNNVGLTIGSIIYDFGERRLNEIYPDKRLAQLALRAAKPGVFPNGAYGGGRMAMTGGGFGCNAHSGQGGAFRQIGDIKIAAFTVVNGLGVVTDRDGRVVSCYPAKGWPKDLKTSYLMGNTPASLRPGWDGKRSVEPERKNTTISLVITNRKLTPSQLQRLAVQVHTSMARAIQPFSTEVDGDVLYAVSTQEVDGNPGDGLVTLDLGTVASELMWDAVLKAQPVQPAAAVPDAKRVISPRLLARYAGDYLFSPLASLRLTVRAGKLYGQAIGVRPIFSIPKNNEVELLPVTDAKFMVPGRYPVTLSFSDGRLVLNPGRWQQIGTRLSR